MPYIKIDRRNLIVEDGGRIDGPIIHSNFIENAGDLNFAVTELIIDYVAHKGLSYQTINDVVGVLTCSKDEFQRRITASYEDSKIKENGDVYPNEWSKK